MSFLFDLFKRNAEDNSPPEWRESLKLTIAASLALSSWVFVGYLMNEQFKSSVFFAQKLELTSPTDKDRIIQIKDANDMVGKTSNSLYSLLTPIATAISGFFFVSSGKNKVGNDTPPPEPDGNDTSPP